MRRTLCNNVIATNRTQSNSHIWVVGQTPSSGAGCSNSATGNQTATATGGNNSVNVAVNVILQANICGNNTEVEIGAADNAALPMASPRGCSNVQDGDQEASATGQNNSVNVAPNVIAQANICGNTTEVEIGYIPLTLAFEGLHLPENDLRDKHVNLNVNGKPADPSQFVAETNPKNGALTLRFFGAPA